MIDPTLWSAVPFRNRTAFLDFIGTHWLWHRDAAPVIFDVTGITNRVYPLGDFGAAWHRAHQQQHVGEHQALGLPAPPDLESYDLSDANAFASFMYIHAQDHRLIQAAAGIP